MKESLKMLEEKINFYFSNEYKKMVGESVWENQTAILTCLAYEINNVKQHFIVKSTLQDVKKCDDESSETAETRPEQLNTDLILLGMSVMNAGDHYSYQLEMMKEKYKDIISVEYFEQLQALRFNLSDKEKNKYLGINKLTDK